VYPRCISGARGEPLPLADFAARRKKLAAPGPHGLFGDDGALTRNTITENGVTKKGRGVTCKACGESTQKTDHGAWLAHVSALAKDPGGGWAICKKQEDCGTPEARVLWRDAFLKIKESAKEKRRSGSTGAPPALEQPPPPPQLTRFGAAPVGVPAAGTMMKVFDIQEHQLMTKMFCMTCFEGNIAPFALCQNQSYSNSIDFLLSGWDVKGQSWKPPSQKFVLGTGLKAGFKAMQHEVDTVFCPLPQTRRTLATDGGDTISKDKIINFCEVFDAGAVFQQIVHTKGQHADAEWISKTHTNYIDKRGGVIIYNQIVMDNTQCNKNSWDLIERYYDYLIICSGCKCHSSNLVFKHVASLDYAKAAFEKMANIVHFFNAHKCHLLPLLRQFQVQIYGDERSCAAYLLSPALSRAARRLRSRSRIYKLHPLSHLRHHDHHWHDDDAAYAVARSTELL